MGLQFDPVKHQYTYGGAVVPGVTSLLSVLNEYAGIPEAVLAAAADRGTYVHKQCELVATGDMDWEKLDPDYAGYVWAFQAFLDETGFKPEYTEEPVYHPVLKYAGTLDIMGIMPPRGRQKKARRAQVDLKTTFKLMAAVGPQTAAYQMAWNKTHPDEQAQDRYALRLKEDGDYELVPLTNKMHEQVFLSAINIHNFMTRGDLR